MSSEARVKPDAKFSFFTNDFDMLRLIAAGQVLLYHGLEHLAHGEPTWLSKLLFQFPGVPIFFALSGYLVSASYDRSRTLKSYARKRLLRIYPGLWACLGVSVAMILAFGQVQIHWPKALAWLLGQVSIGQFYTPDFLRGYGLGAPNGSLWTIAVELQFYAVLPVAGLILARVGRRDLTLLGAVAVFIGVHLWFADHKLSDPSRMWVKLLGVSFLPWVYLFFFGMWLQRRQDLIERFAAGKVLWWTLLYGVVVVGSQALGCRTGGNYLNPLAAIVLAVWAISFAYSFQGRLSRPLGGNDISYGVYIYHGVFINVLVETKALSSWSAMAVMCLCSIGFALASWRWIEKPALKLKPRDAAKTSHG